MFSFPVFAVNQTVCFTRIIIKLILFLYLNWVRSPPTYLDKWFRPTARDDVCPSGGCLAVWSCSGRKTNTLRDSAGSRCCVFEAEAAAGTACPLRGDGLAPAGPQPEDHRGCEER